LGFPGGERPAIVNAGEVTAGDHAGELFDEEAALATAAQAQLADQLLVARAATGGAADARQKITVTVRIGGAGHA
jgi:hypothetical protein